MCAHVPIYLCYAPTRTRPPPPPPVTPLPLPPPPLTFLTLLKRPPLLASAWVSGVARTHGRRPGPYTKAHAKQHDGGNALATERCKCWYASLRPGISRVGVVWCYSSSIDPTRLYSTPHRLFSAPDSLTPPTPTPLTTGDSLFFHYSGHGGRQKDQDGDEKDGYDEVTFSWLGYVPVSHSLSHTLTRTLTHTHISRSLPLALTITQIYRPGRRSARWTFSKRVSSWTMNSLTCSSCRCRRVVV